MTTLFDKYFTYVTDTEPPLVFHRWSALTSLGAFLGRQYYLPFGEFNIYPNMYVMLIGDPGTRKSTAIKLAKRILSSAGYTTFNAEQTSKEKFLLDLEGLTDDEGVVKDADGVMKTLFGESMAGSSPKEVFVAADEFNDFIGQGNLDFMSLLGSLWDWDDPINPFRKRLKNSKSVAIYQPTISILGGNTHAGFAEAFPPQALGQGFLSRLLLIYGERTDKRIAWPIRPPADVKEGLINDFLEIKNKVVGEASISDKARSMLETIYRTFEPLSDFRFKHYSTRRHTHLLKLVLLCAASNKRTDIRAEDVLLAHSLLCFTEHYMPMALGEFGKAKNSDVASKIIAVLNEAKAPVDIASLWAQVQSDLDRVEDLNKIMIGLVQGGKIQYIARTKTSSVQGYLPLRKALSTKPVYCDYSLLTEAKHLIL